MKERIREIYLELRQHVLAIVVLWMESVRLRLSIALADVKQKAFNKRYHVVSVVVGRDKQGKAIQKLRSINELEFLHCKRAKLLPKRMTYLELERSALYSTSLSKNNTHKREEREKAREKYRMMNRVAGIVTG